LSWRLLDFAALSGAENMALDEAVLQQVAAADSPPTLRLYGWSPPCVSLGYFQGEAAEVLRLDECAARGVGVVRRPTGGGAILHHREVTYSLCLPESEWAGLSTAESYERICAALSRGLASLGLGLSPRGPGGTVGAGGEACLPDRTTDICFARGSRHDLVSGGRKLVGSAQRRIKGGLLQHGSVLLSVDRELHRALFRREAGWRGAFCGLDELGGREFGSDEVAGALAGGVREMAGAGGAGGLKRSGLTDSEVEAAARFAAERYADPDWSILSRRARRRSGSHAHIRV